MRKNLQYRSLLTCMHPHAPVALDFMHIYQLNFQSLALSLHHRLSSTASSAIYFSNLLSLSCTLYELTEVRMHPRTFWGTRRVMQATMGLSGVVSSPRPCCRYLECSQNCFMSSDNR